MGPKDKADAIKLIAKNRKAFHDYEILERLEAGIALVGSEVKSIRSNCGVAFTDCYARVKNGELWLIDLHIAPYTNASYQNHQPTRPRKLLLHRREIEKLATKIERLNLSVIPIDLYFKRGFVKVELGVGKGKKNYDKRESIKKRDDQRYMTREGRRDRDR